MLVICRRFGTALPRLLSSTAILMMTRQSCWTKRVFSTDWSLNPRSTLSCALTCLEGLYCLLDIVFRISTYAICFTDLRIFGKKALEGRRSRSHMHFSHALIRSRKLC